MKLDRFQLVEKSSKAGFLPIFIHDDPEISFDVLKSCYDGGCRLFEFTNRSINAFETFEYLLSRIEELPGISLGVGTIMDIQQGEKYIDLGAHFIVAPIMDKKVGELCAAYEIAWVPGCGSLTEIVEAQRTGASLVKLFPANVLGPSFLKAILGPCPELHVMPAGGVAPTHVSLSSWYTAGAVCVAMGSKLFQYDWRQSDSFRKLKVDTAQLIQVIQDVRNG